jgi:hypothetical protein
MSLGYNCIQGTTSGPEVNGAGQYYCSKIILGMIYYDFTGAGSYGGNLVLVEM